MARHDQGLNSLPFFIRTMKSQELEGNTNLGVEALNTLQWIIADSITVALPTLRMDGTNITFFNASDASATITGATGGNVSLAVNTATQFICKDGAWYQVSLQSAAPAALGTYTALVGNNAATDFDVVHGLNSTTLLSATLVDVSADPPELVIADITIIDEDTVNVAFADPPTTNQYRISILTPGA